MRLCLSAASFACSYILYKTFLVLLQVLQFQSSFKVNASKFESIVEHRAIFIWWLFIVGHSYKLLNAFNSV